MGENDRTNYAKVSFIERAPTRQKVLSLLNGSDVFTPSEIAEEIDKHRQNISRVLSEMEEKELVNCLTPDANKYRYYEITDEGKDVLNEIDTR